MFKIFSFSVPCSTLQDFPDSGYNYTLHQYRTKTETKRDVFDVLVYVQQHKTVKAEINVNSDIIAGNPGSC